MLCGPTSLLCVAAVQSDNSGDLFQQHPLVTEELLRREPTTKWN
jgi:hypothetical protein